nr:hypothetical protein [uncultured Acetatifactor sp.]
MTKEFEKFIADKPELNIATKEEVSLLKIKLGKSHRKESDWEVIKDIFYKRDLITFIPSKKMKGIKLVEELPCEWGYLIAFSNIDDCTQYIDEKQYRLKSQSYVQIISVPFMDICEIADRNDVDVLIDVNGGINSRCFIYAHREERLKAVIMADNIL